MREYLKRLPKEFLELVYLARGLAAEKKMRVYLVGGFVRDLILGVKNLDLDIVVEGDAIGFARDYSRKLRAELFCHHRFGTATVLLGSQQKVDFSSARQESYLKPAHLPVVRNGSLKDDLYRRDFTVNAMAISLSPDNFGALIDFFGGKKDLEAKKIRILHGLSFIDDPTRILRAVRFEQRYDFRIEPQTLKKIKEAVDLRMLEKVNPHRLRDDLVLVLKEKFPLKEIKRLQGLCGFSFISRRLSLGSKSYALLRSLERQVDWFRRNYPRRRPLDTWLIYLSGIMDSLEPRQIRDCLRRFAFRKGEEKRILSCRQLKAGLISDLGRKALLPAKIFALLEPLSYEAILFLRAKYGDRFLLKNSADFLEIYSGMSICIGGKDLHSLGIAPGPAYQKIFLRVLKAKLNGKVKTKDEELALIKKFIRGR